MDGSNISDIFVSFTRHILSNRYMYDMFDTQILRLHITVNKHVYQMQVIYMIKYGIFGV